MKRSQFNVDFSESKKQVEENSDFLLVRATIHGGIFLGIQKSSRMAAFVRKSKNVKFSLNLNNLYWQTSIQLAFLTELND